MTQLELTKRDLLLFERLGSYGALTTKQLRQIVFPGICESIALRRLRRLKRKGYLLTHTGLGHGRLVWTVSKKALDRIGSDLSPIGINKHTLEHDILVSQVRLRLEQNGIGDHWKSGFFLKQKTVESESSAAKQIPDMLFAIKTRQGPKVFALELETVQKSKRRYRQILANYSLKSGIHFIWYIVRSKALGDFLVNKSGLIDSQQSPKVLYSLLEDVLDNRRPVTLIGLESRVELIKAGDQVLDQGVGSQAFPRAI